MLAVGVDCWRGGWVGVVLEDGAYRSALAAPRLADVVAHVPGAAVFGVDIPIGLPDSGRRSADLAARAFVGPRHNSVFLVEPRAVWEAVDDVSARAVSLALEGRSVPSQTLALRPRILEADALARLEPRLREVHPEVSFAAMAGRPLAHPKWTWGGMLLRMALLEQAGIVIPADIADAGSAGIDDVLDAAAAAWSATRLARGGAGSLPADPRLGPDGHVAAIWY
jgi:predicted RNase H-like nuclease